MLYLSTEIMQDIERTMVEMSANGVSAAEDHSGEMNFSGCASGSCMAWA
jgi:hypothetical protein